MVACLSQQLKGYTKDVTACRDALWATPLQVHRNLLHSSHSTEKTKGGLSVLDFHLKL